MFGFVQDRAEGSLSPPASRVCDLACRERTRENHVEVETLSNPFTFSCRCTCTRTCSILSAACAHQGEISNFRKRQQLPAANACPPPSHAALDHLAVGIPRVDIQDFPLFDCCYSSSVAPLPAGPSLGYTLCTCSYLLSSVLPPSARSVLLRMPRSRCAAAEIALHRFDHPQGDRPFFVASRARCGVQPKAFHRLRFPSFIFSSHRQ